MAVKKKTKKTKAKSRKTSPKTKRGAVKKKPSLEDIQNFSSGKIDDATLRRVGELEEVLGIKTINPFGTNEPALFEENLKEATVSDLQNLCTKVGVFPDGSRDRMRDKLRKEFQRITRGSRTISMEQPLGIADPNHPDHEKAKKLMSEGF
jgi:hypothetical protein